MRESLICADYEIRLKHFCFNLRPLEMNGILYEQVVVSGCSISSIIFFLLFFFIIIILFELLTDLQCKHGKEINRAVNSFG